MTHHGAALRALSKDGLPDRLAADPADGGVPVRLRAILDYALRVTREPERMGQDDVERLRSAGLADEEIHRVALVAAYFNFVNRVAQGLGVELEQES